VEQIISPRQCSSVDLKAVHSDKLRLETCDKLLGLKLNVDGCHPRADRAV